MEFNKDLIDSYLTYICEVCDKEAVMRCEDTRKNFCSKKCYDKLMKNSNDNQETNESDIKISDVVIISAIINERCIYVHKQTDDLNQILDEVYLCGRNASPLQMAPEINDLVFVKVDNDIFRAVVLAEQNEEFLVAVRLIDVGNTLQVKVEDLFEMNEECFNIKCLTTKLILRDVDIEALNIYAVKYLKDLLLNETELKVKSIDEDQVELIDTQNNTLINNKIIKLATFEESIKYPDDYFFLPKEIISVGKKRKLFVVSSYKMHQTGEICCVEEKYLKNFYEFYKSLNFYGNMLNPSDYGMKGIDLISLVKVNNQWHRGKVIDHVGDGKPTCWLYDFQIVCKINVENIFELPDKFANELPLTEICCIDGYNVENEYTKKVYDEMIKENEFVLVDEVILKEKSFILKFNISQEILQSN